MRHFLKAFAQIRKVKENTMSKRWDGNWDCNRLKQKCYEMPKHWNNLWLSIIHCLSLKISVLKKADIWLLEHNSCLYENHKYSLYESPNNTATFQRISQKEKMTLQKIQFFTKNSLFILPWLLYGCTLILHSALKALYVVSLAMYHIRYSTNLQQIGWLYTSSWGFLRNIHLHVSQSFFNKENSNTPKELFLRF